MTLLQKGLLDIHSIKKLFVVYLKHSRFLVKANVKPMSNDQVQLQHKSWTRQKIFSSVKHASLFCPNIKTFEEEFWQYRSWFILRESLGEIKYQHYFTTLWGCYMFIVLYIEYFE